MWDHFWLFTNFIAKSQILYKLAFVWNFCTALPWTPPKQSETAESLQTNFYFIRFDSILSCECLIYVYNEKNYNLGKMKDGRKNSIK